MAIRILKSTCYSIVTTVWDGQQAVNEIHRQGGAKAFDVILTDLQMPHKVISLLLAAHGYVLGLTF